MILRAIFLSVALPAVALAQSANPVTVKLPPSVQSLGVDPPSPAPSNADLIGAYGKCLKMTHKGPMSAARRPSPDDPVFFDDDAATGCTALQSQIVTRESAATEARRSADIAAVNALAGKN